MPQYADSVFEYWYSHTGVLLLTDLWVWTQLTLIYSWTAIYMVGHNTLTQCNMVSLVPVWVLVCSHTGVLLLTRLRVSTWSWSRSLLLRQDRRERSWMCAAKIKFGDIGYKDNWLEQYPEETAISSSQDFLNWFMILKYMCITLQKKLVGHPEICPKFKMVATIQNCCYKSKGNTWAMHG